MQQIKSGSKGEVVELVQRMLNEKGYACGSADGIFGTKTKNAVEKYQKAKGLSVDGIVGDNTYAKLFADCLLKNGSRGELEQGNWSGVIHVCSSHEKNLRSRIEPFSETDENGVIVRAGYVIDMWEVPDRAPSGSGSITAGYGYPNEAGPIPEDFDIVFIVRYRDGEVTYSVREMGLLDPAG